MSACQNEREPQTIPSLDDLIARLPFKELIKALLFRPGDHEHSVLGGALKGMRFRFDLRADTQRWRGIHERPLQRWLRRHVEPGSTCLDIGAADGYYTLLMAKLAGPSGSVHAFEPSPLCERITEHVKLNCERHALAPVNAHRLFVAAEAAHARAPSTTVDELVRRESLERVDVVKVDVDGAEGEVVHGAAETLERFRPHVFVEVHSRALLEEVRDALAGYGYPLRLEPPASYEYRPIEYNVFLFSDGRAPARRPEA